MLDGERLGEVLGKYLQDSGLSAFIANDKLKTCWEEAVGRQMLAHTKLMGIRNQILFVEVDSSPRLQELKCFLKPQILQQFQHSYRRVFVKDISFTLGSF